jgi:hypothetical protein
MLDQGEAVQLGSELRLTTQRDKRYCKTSSRRVAPVLYVRAMEERGLAASTIDRRLSTVCGFYRFARKKPDVPAENFTQPPKCCDDTDVGDFPSLEVPTAADKMNVNIHDGVRLCLVRTSVHGN